MAAKGVSVLKLTDEMRNKIAQDLGVTDKMDKVPKQITIVGVKSADLGGVTFPAGPHSAVMINM